ncbi:TrbC/VirB2 family protein [Catellicoccus marimammalium]|uniref:Uncharacterized protein n=1 Tax=Catellicoccus marimammalium M35/04/3 TaxID=1234409 RepID=K8ZAZ4_9ENTE|nr:TrbC/VirB2 family protein [Catellicoccus marimammalium]EKU27212.1 hypothetical protein C683_0869 [Catellicoccus marimammalium M35/04/3]
MITNLVLNTAVGQQLLQTYLQMPFNAGDIFGKLSSALGQVHKGLTVLTVALAICAFACVGIMFIASDRMADKAKSWGLRIGVGVIISLTAQLIVSWIQGLV